KVMVKQDSCKRDSTGKRIEPPRPTSADQKPILFGWQAVPKNCRRIIITEGEIDAMSWAQCGQPALSVPFGGGTGAKHQWLDHEYDDLERFDEILLSFDNDATGQAAIEDLVNRLGPYRCRIIEGLPTKDANEALQKEILDPDTAKALVNRAKFLDPEELRKASIYTDQVVEMFHPNGDEPGFYSPWEKTTYLFKFRPAELTIINGVNGHGKSEVMGHLMLAAMDQGERVCIASMELQPKRLLHRLMRQACAVTGAVPTPEYIRAGMHWTEEKLWLFDVTGTAKAKRILEVFEYAHKRYGIKTFVVDSLMKCGIAEDDYNGQKAFIEALCDFKNKYSLHIFLVTHSRKGESEEKPTGKMDIKGTGAISDLADNVFVIWRNKPKERDIQRLEKGEFRGKENPQTALEEAHAKPDAVLYCCKQRNGDWEGAIGLHFCPYTKQYLNSQSDKPKPYINYQREYGVAA
ncbi:bifunctional DNA primase/helicase, partial [Arthrospira platensis SPKY1]|nr:bifunctional DNA primase/helicase [Arthrospira platensis SPKY1]